MTKISNAKIVPLVLIAIMVVSVCAGSVVMMPKVAAQAAQTDTMQFRYDAAHTGDYSAVAGSTPPNNQLKWQIKTSAMPPIPDAYGSPAVVDGVVYIGGDRLFAIDAATGVEKWNYTFSQYAIFSSPAVAGGSVYVGAYINGIPQVAVLCAIDSATGTEEWRFTTGNGRMNTPTVVGDTVYVGTSGGTLYAFDATAHNVKWSKQFYSRSGTWNCVPAVADGTVYVFEWDNNKVYALDAVTGGEKWSTPSTYAWPSDICVANNVVYVQGKDFSALDVTTGQLLWRFEGGNDFGEIDIKSSIVSQGVAYITSGDYISPSTTVPNNVTAFEATTGDKLWNVEIESAHAKLVAANGIVYVGGEYSSGGGSLLYALDATDGGEIWRYHEEWAIGYEMHFPAIVDGVMYVSWGQTAIYTLDAIGTQSTPTNQPPTAYAGTDQLSEHIGAQVTLRGSGSDPNGDIDLTYSWSMTEKPEGSTATLSGEDTATPSFTPDIIGDYALTLVVTDSLGAASAPDEVLIHADNAAPTAVIVSSAQTVKAKSTVQLDASGSSDPNPDDGDSLTYAWTLTKPDKSKAQLSNDKIVNPTLMTDKAGTYRIQLVVTDDHGAKSVVDEMIVTAVNKMPKEK